MKGYSSRNGQQPWLISKKRKNNVDELAQFSSLSVKSAPHLDFTAFSNYMDGGRELNVGRPGTGSL